MTDETRKVLGEILSIPPEPLSTAVRELAGALHARALEYAGEMPGTDAAEYEAWATKMEAYKLAAAWSLFQFESLP